ncbi:MAG: immunoglobulin domain-containing protein, partial [Candidatus Acidiferrales bacterium]
MSRLLRRSQFSAVLILTAVLAFAVVLGDCGGNGTNAPPGGGTAPSITTQPASQSVAAGQTATFTVVATGTAPLSYQWQKDSANISGAASVSYTTPATVAADKGTTYRVVVSNSAGSVTSNSATLTVQSAASPSGAAVLTYHNDISRTGLNSNETTLTAANVNPAQFGKLGTMPVTGLVDAEPLYVGGLTINGAVHNVLFIATEHDMVYAFDADSFAQLWSASTLANFSGETTVTTGDV